MGEIEACRLQGRGRRSPSSPAAGLTRCPHHAHTSTRPRLADGGRAGRALDRERGRMEQLAARECWLWCCRDAACAHTQAKTVIDMPASTCPPAPPRRRRSGAAATGSDCARDDTRRRTCPDRQSQGRRRQNHQKPIDEPKPADDGVQTAPTQRRSRNRTARASLRTSSDQAVSITRR